MAKFAIDSKVTVKQIDGSTHYDELVGLEGTVTCNSDEWSDGSRMCPHIMVDFGGDVGSYRFYTNELT